MAINTYFKNIADAIREKTGGSAFITPGQMPQAIRDIVSGGDANIINPLHKNVKNGWYVTANGIYGYSSALNVNDIYLIENTGYYFFFVKNQNIGNRMRIGIFNNDPVNFTPSPSASASNPDLFEQPLFAYDFKGDAIIAYTIVYNASGNKAIKYVDNVNKFFVVTKNNTGTLTDEVYCMRLNV